MANRLSSDSITVFVETVDNGAERASTAEFIWAEGNPSETYNVQVDEHLSMNFDRHLPVRPARMRWLSSVVAGEVVQSALADRLLPDMAVGMFATSIVLDPALRLELAHLQAENHKTPLLLRQVCQAMIHRAELAGEATPVE